MTVKLAVIFLFPSQSFSYQQLACSTKRVSTCEIPLCPSTAPEDVRLLRRRACGFTRMGAAVGQAGTAGTMPAPVCRRPAQPAGQITSHACEFVASLITLLCTSLSVRDRVHYPKSLLTILTCRLIAANQAAYCTPTVFLMLKTVFGVLSKHPCAYRCAAFSMCRVCWGTKAAVDTLTNKYVCVQEAHCSLGESAAAHASSAKERAADAHVWQALLDQADQRASAMSHHQTPANLLEGVVWTVTDPTKYARLEPFNEHPGSHCQWQGCVYHP